MSSVLIHDASSAAAPIAATVLDFPASGSPHQGCHEKDISYWQRSLEVLSQKVIVGDTVCVVKREKKNQEAEVLQVDQVILGGDSQKQQEISAGDESQQASIPVEAIAEACCIVDAYCDGNAHCCDEEDGDANDTSEEQQQQQQQQIQNHDSNLFRLSCCCGACFNYRETIIQLFVEDFEYNTLWERLQLLIKKFYDFIPE